MLYNVLLRQFKVFLWDILRLNKTDVEYVLKNNN